MQNSKYYSNILSIQPICRYTRYSVACNRWQFHQIYLKLTLEPIYRYKRFYCISNLIYEKFQLNVILNIIIRYLYLLFTYIAYQLINYIEYH